MIKETDVRVGTGNNRQQ